MSEVDRTVTIRNRLGLHARPAGEFVKTASKFESKITIAKGELEVNGKSIMGVMMLAASQGTELIIRTSGHDEQEAADQLERLVAEKFGEDE